MEMISKVDVFVSYQHESEGIVLKIVDALEKNGIKCWYAPRNIISGSYAKSICDGIGRCKVFLLVLTDEASNSQHVLNEVELAYKRLDSGIILMPFKISKEITNEEMNYYINRLQWIDAMNNPLEKAINELLNVLKPMFGISDADSEEKIMGGLSATKRDMNNYFLSDDDEEINRLEEENELLYPYEEAIYDEIFFNQDNLNVLDINVLHPKHNLKRFYRKEVGKYLGTLNQKENEELFNNYQKDNYEFLYVDLADSHFDNKIKTKMSEIGIRGFDLINISMVILDTLDPKKVLSRLRRLLNPKGTIYVRDIDDGFTLYYPDEDGIFKKFFKLVDADKYAGFRKSGRQIYSYLKYIGAHDISLKMQGLSSVNLDYLNKSRLFNAYMTFAKHEYERLVKEENSNEDYKLALEWLEENMPLIEEKFFEDNFFFNAGYVIYVAKF